jgi:hypothetical protein
MNKNLGSSKQSSAARIQSGRGLCKNARSCTISGHSHIRRVCQNRIYTPYIFGLCKNARSSTISGHSHIRRVCQNRIYTPYIFGLCKNARSCTISGHSQIRRVCQNRHRIYLVCAKTLAPAQFQAIRIFVGFARTVYIHRIYWSVQERSLLHNFRPLAHSPTNNMLAIT